MIRSCSGLGTRVCGAALLAGLGKDAGPVDSIPEGDLSFQCNVSEGTSVAVPCGVITRGVDFDLVRGGSLEGTVTAETGGQPIAHVGIVAFDGTGTRSGSTSTDDSGHYRLVGLETGTYFAVARSPGGRSCCRRRWIFQDWEGIYVVDADGARLLSTKGETLAHWKNSREIKTAAFDGELLVVVDAAAMVTLDRHLNEIGLWNIGRSLPIWRARG